MKPHAHVSTGNKRNLYREAAEEVGLRYVYDDSPGIRRIKKGKKFSYVDGAGKVVRETRVLKRIFSLVIPPAWIESTIRSILPT
jgi:DNA topoisomerase-1